ncbi:MAG: hypothetical protein ACT4NJ_09210 [Nitrosopumilaceae archaeon]
MRKLLLVLFAVSFSISLGANQEAYAGGQFKCGIPNIPNGDGSSCDGTLDGRTCPTWTCNTGFTKSGTDPKCIFDPPGSMVLIYSGSFQCVSPDNVQVIGGKIIPIDTTVLYITGIQTSASWMIPAVLSAAGLGLVLVKRK